MIHRPSRRDIVKATVRLTAIGSLGLRDAANARAAAPIKPEPRTFSQIDSMFRAATRTGEIPGVVPMAATDHGFL